MREQLYACEPAFLLAYLDRLENATEAEIELAASLFGESDEEDPIYEEDAEGNGRLRIEGPLSMAGPSPLARLFGFEGTGYRQILAWVQDYHKGKYRPKALTLAINSPGGEVAGVDQCYQAIRALAEEIPVTAENTGMMASAAYWLAAGAKRIVATSPSCEQGAIGVKIVAIDDSKLADAVGIKVVTIVSRGAPRKNTDVATKTGRSVLQDRADAMERQFVARVAQGRNVSAEKVLSDFGQGGLLVAEDPNGEPDALSAGMIDDVVEPHGIRGAQAPDLTRRFALTGRLAAQADTKPAQAGHKETPMTLKELLASDPAARAEYDKAVAEARAEGVKSVQARIDAAKPFLALAVTKDGYTEAEVAQIRKCAIDVIAGTEDAGALRGFVRMVDMQVEGRKQAAAEKETAEQPETPAQHQPVGDAALLARATALKIDVKAVEAAARASGQNPTEVLKAEVEMRELVAREKGA